MVTLAVVTRTNLISCLLKKNDEKQLSQFASYLIVLWHLCFPALKALIKKGTENLCNDMKTIWIV